MAGNADNIIIGAATVAIDGEDVGYTTGGTTVRYEPTFFDVMADQAIGVVRKGRSSEKLFVVTSLLEITLKRIMQAFNQPSANLVGSTLTLGYNNSCDLNEHSIVLVGVGPDCAPRTFTLFRCTSIGNKEIKMNREGASELAVEFECMKNSNGRFGIIVDV